MSFNGVWFLLRQGGFAESVMVDFDDGAVRFSGGGSFTVLRVGVAMEKKDVWVFCSCCIMGFSVCETKEIQGKNNGEKFLCWGRLWTVGSRKDETF